MYKTENCGKLNLKFKNKEVTLAGWVNSKRDHGKVIFIDLRDFSGIVQLVITPENKEIYKLTESIGPEFVIQAKGKLQERPDGMKNPNVPTGEVEVLVTALKIFSSSKTPPFEIDKDTSKVKEEIRLKYRYLDLRSERMKNNLKKRYEVIQYFRDYLKKENFVEVNTPILSKSTPEGARDYLVPSRLHKGKFFALPQSPQQYKQLLMLAGVERYFQIAPCFRDEDARADRHPGDFYQLDMEMAFVEREDVLEMTEKMFTEMIKKLFPEKKITESPWPRLKHKEVIKKYKSDKPDLRKDKKDKNELAFAWIIDFPLFVKQTKEDFFHGAGKEWAPSHHMFTAPKEEDLDMLNKDPGKVHSYQYDLVLNGFELGGGSIRISDRKIQEKIYDLIGFSEKDKEKFKHLLTAFQYGVPPHGGIAPGVDRLLAIVIGEPNLREVTPFPLSGDGRDPMMGSPSEVDKKQLKELGLEIIKR